MLLIIAGFFVGAASLNHDRHNYAGRRGRSFLLPELLAEVTTLVRRVDFGSDARRFGRSSFADRVASRSTGLIRRYRAS